MIPKPRADISTHDSATVIREMMSGIGALTAFAGGGQASAVNLTRAINVVSTVATAADSVKLPPAKVGATILVFNKAAANSLNIFPQTGDAINALGANTAYALAVTKGALFACAVNGTWHTILTA